MKILNVNMSIDPVRGGGTGERTVQMSKALSELGHSCAILTLDLGITRSLRNNLESTKNLKLITLPCLNKRSYFPFPNIIKISRAVSDSDIVHLMGHWTILNAIVYFYIKKNKKKYVVCPAGALPIFGRSKFLKTLYNIVVGRKIIRNANLHFVIAEDEIQQLKEYGVSSKKVVMVPNGINPSSLQVKNDDLFREKYSLGKAPFIFYLGRLNLIKGPDLLLEAFCSLKNELKKYHLVIAGPDEGMQVELEKMIEINGLKNRVHIIGHILSEIKSQALHAASLMVIPSRQEAMSIVVLEAGIVGLPVLLTNQCGLNDLKLINAAVVVGPNVAEIRSGLLDILSDSSRLESIGKNLQKHVYNNFLWTSIAKKIEGIYENL